jgi:two-component system, chemotaxis family, chemotaxis protein CheY
MSATKSILVVDDSAMVRETLSQFLTLLGFRDVDCAIDGSDALQKLRTKPYDLVISDWEMDPMPGDQLVQTMRREDALRQIPFITVSAGACAEKATDAGADGFLAKPFRMAALRAKIEQVCSWEIDTPKPETKPV